MSYIGMIRLKLKFCKSMQNEITKKYQFYFSFILEIKKKKDYMTKHFNSEKKEKEGKEKMKID